MPTSQKRIDRVFQPPNSSVCGQACIAMICAITLSEAIRIVGKNNGCTTGPDLSRALKKLGVKASLKMVRFGKCKRLYRGIDCYKSMPARCIAKVRSAGVKQSHWILVWDGKKYDPYPGRIPWEYISGYIKIWEQ